MLVTDHLGVQLAEVRHLANRTIRTSLDPPVSLLNGSMSTDPRVDGSKGLSIHDWTASAIIEYNYSFIVFTALSLILSLSLLDPSALGSIDMDPLRTMTAVWGESAAHIGMTCCQSVTAQPLVRKLYRRFSTRTTTAVRGVSTAHTSITCCHLVVTKRAGLTKRVGCGQI